MYLTQIIEITGQKQRENDPTSSYPPPLSQGYTRVDPTPSVPFGGWRQRLASHRPLPPVSSQGIVTRKTFPSDGFMPLSWSHPPHMPPDPLASWASIPPLLHRGRLRSAGGLVPSTRRKYYSQGSRGGDGLPHSISLLYPELGSVKIVPRGCMYSSPPPPSALDR